MKNNTLTQGRVSIIIPIYNGEKYIHRCLKSILDQSYKNIELILINDGSEDNSGGICDEYVLKDKRIKVIHKKNTGPAAARNKGIKNSGGEFILFVDIDDVIEKESLSLLIKTYKQQEADMIIGDFKRIKKGSIVERTDFPLLNNKLLTKKDLIDCARLYLKKPNKYLLFAYSWGRLFKSSIIKENNLFFDIRLHTYEDVAFNFGYLNHVNKVYFLKEIVYYHTIGEDNVSATMAFGDNPERLFGYKQALIKIRDFLKNNLSDFKIRREIGHADVSLTIIQLVRTCTNLNHQNKKIISKFIKKLVNNLDLRSNLKFYSPSKGESKILPLLIKLKLIFLIILVCKYKANKRYKKRVITI